MVDAEQVSVPIVQVTVVLAQGAFVMGAGGVVGSTGVVGSVGIVGSVGVAITVAGVSSSIAPCSVGAGWPAELAFTVSSLVSAQF